MSGLVGRGSRSFKKKIVEQSLIPALGIKKVRFAHRAPAAITPDPMGNGRTTILFSGFIPPPEMVAEGFSNPSSTEITNLRTGQFRNNVRIESNLNGVLIDQVAYTITDTSFTLQDFYMVTEGEIFVITVGSNPVTGNRIVDARPLRASGDVDFSGIGSAVVDFSTGQGFRVAGSTINSAGDDNQQIGNVQVFVDGVLQFRNAGNGDEDSMAATDQTGNYREIALNPTGTIITGVDYANAVRFNMGQPFSSTEGVLVVATNLIVDEPNGTGLTSIVDNNSANILVNTTELATIPAASTGAVAQELRVNAGQTAYELYTPSSGAGLIQINEFTTTGTPTLVVPSDTAVIEFEAAGGGGGGGNGVFVNLSGASPNGNATGGGGGGAGGYAKFQVNVVSGNITGINIGAASSSASAGNDTSFTYNGVTYTLSGGATGLIGQGRGPTFSQDTSRNLASIGGLGGGGGSTVNIPNNAGKRGRPGQRGGSFVASLSSGMASLENQTIGGDDTIQGVNTGNTRFAPGGLGGSTPIATGGNAIIGESGGFGGHLTGGAGGGGAGLVDGGIAVESGDARNGGPGGRGGLIVRFYSGTTLNIS